MAIAILNVFKAIGTNVANEQQLTAGRFAYLNVDATTLDTVSYPIAKPDETGDPHNYSYEVWLKWELANDFGGYVQNMKLWGSGFPIAGSVIVMLGSLSTTGTPVDTWAGPATAIAATTQHDNYYDSSNYLYIPIAGDGRLDEIGDDTGYVITQIRVMFGASDKVDLTLFNVSYEEVS